MKFHAGITALAVGVGLSALGCEQAPTSLDAPDIRAAVKVVDTNEFVDVVDFAVVNPCNGQVILFTGTSHDKVQMWDNGHWKFHFQYNLTGTDANGVTYRLTDAFNQQGNAALPVTYNYTAKMIRSPNEDTSLYKEHITLNANGELTASTPFGFKCVG
ncbi:MAG: hypothetical protein P8Y26_09520 [Gemmatimonadales bacterium]